jgi:hypothetical protein
MIRFIAGSAQAYELMEGLIQQHFPDLKKAKILVLFDRKKRVHGNKLVLARMMRSNDLIRRLTDQIEPEGYDYVMFLDKVIFDTASEIDKTRLIRHELRHAFVEYRAKNPYKLIPHDIEDFEAEIALNKDDVGWAKRAASLAMQIYDEDEEQDLDDGRLDADIPQPDDKGKIIYKIKRN